MFSQCLSECTLHSHSPKTIGPRVADPPSRACCQIAIENVVKSVLNLMLWTSPTFQVARLRGGFENCADTNEATVMTRTRKGILERDRNFIQNECNSEATENKLIV